MVASPINWVVSGRQSSISVSSAREAFATVMVIFLLPFPLGMSASEIETDSDNTGIVTPSQPEDNASMLLLTNVAF